MINRHLLRIKVLQIAYAYFTKESTIEKSLNELDKSIRQTKELYAKLLLLPLELRDIATQKLANQEQAHVQKSVDLSLQKFAENQFLEYLQASKSLQSFCNNEKISWAGQEDLLLKLYYELLERPFFQQYLAGDTDAAKDKQLVYNIIAKFLSKKEDLDEIFEEQNLYWNDDLWTVMPMLQQAIKKVNVEEEFTLPELYKKLEDANFAKELFLKTIRLEEENRALIETTASNWEYERMALIDRILLGMGITELLHFETIPMKVTLNEYVEISKYYSTKNSSTFINGILDKIAKQKDAVSLKKGAGRIGNELK